MNMYFGEVDSLERPQNKTIKFYKNGDPSKFADITIKENMKISDFGKELEEKLHIRFSNKLRFFNKEGIELSCDEIQYVKNGDTIYVSKGEDFDRNSGLSEYDIVKRLGEGGFGKVELAIHKKTKEKVAIKFLKATALGTVQDIDFIFAEAQILKNLNHKNVVKILNCFTLNNMQVAFVMEYLDGGELKDYVISKGHLTEEEALGFFKQLTEAVSYLHRENIIHRDLKLENILLESKESKIIKVVDFGISGLCSNISADIDAGSLDYMAPEALTGKKKNVHPGLDIWAMGCILYAMVCGALPFTEPSNKKTVERIITGDLRFPPKIEPTLSREVKDLISRMLVVDYNERYNLSDIMNHEWMNNRKLYHFKCPELQEKIISDIPSNPKPEVKGQKRASFSHQIPGSENKPPLKKGHQHRLSMSNSNKPAPKLIQTKANGKKLSNSSKDVHQKK